MCNWTSRSGLAWKVCFSKKPGVRLLSMMLCLKALRAPDALQESICPGVHLPWSTLLLGLHGSQTLAPESREAGPLSFQPPGQHPRSRPSLFSPAVPHHTTLASTPCMPGPCRQLPPPSLPLEANSPSWPWQRLGHPWTRAIPLTLCFARIN